MNLIRTYMLPYVKRYKWLLLAAIGLGILTVLTGSMLTFTSGYLITRASEMPLTILLLYIPIVAVRTFGISRAVTRYIERLTGHNAVLRIVADMRVKLYELLEPQALFIRSRFQTGDLLGTLADDIEHLQDAYIRTIFPTVVALFLFVYSVTVLALFDWLFAVWIGLCLCIIIFVYPLVSLYVLKKHQIAWKAKRSVLYQTLTDAIFGLSDWMISGRKNRFIEQFMSGSKDSQQTEQHIASWHQSRTLQLHLFSGAILLMVGVWAGMAAQNGDIMPTYIAAFTLVTLPILEGMLPISQAIEKIPSYMESLQRIEQIRQFAPEDSMEPQTIPPLQRPDIAIKDISFRYENQEEEALSRISLSIPHGKKIAILGKSGAGKSTLMQLLQGLMSPTSGEITIGGYHPCHFGERIYDVISVLNQKPYLFATTVENNIRLGKKDADMDEIQRVIAKVKLDEYIQSLPNGMDTQMEETGQRFSGGERQRVALARILLKDSPIVILDEPTVGLDPQTETHLLDTVFSALDGKTVLFITHHLIGMEKMDHIIFLDQGNIAMSGTHEELLANNARYRNLYALDRGE
ncbi:thiol reductant ABC exporter subunit CydC [Aneurinibacillus sp. REN35]|uniref:thiol reductant ABC exporter subunit CydC n=1 Tax=Aneurinibacillus sp. REN35 TaxID=3237286 RepID=UPI003529166A